MSIYFFTIVCKVLISASIAYAAQAALPTSIYTHDNRLQISAVVNEEQPPYHATIECWEMKEEFTKYPTVGSAMSLGDVTNLTYVTLPPKSQEGLHKPPHTMFFVLLSGTAHVTLPAYPEVDGLWIEEGINPVIVATDILGIGHHTAYPGDKPTVALQIPFKNGMAPQHRILHQGPCKSATEYSVVPRYEI